MIPRDAILAFMNRKLGNYELFRALLAHDDWRVPRPEGATRPTILIYDAVATPVICAFSSEESYRASCAALNAAAIGPVARLARLDDALVEDDARVAKLTIDPHDTLVFHVQSEELASFRQIARAVRVERAMSERRYDEVRSYARWAVPYFGVLGQGHNLITLPSERGKMLAAFTAPDAIDAFLSAGSAENRAAVKFAIVDGEQLFGIVQNMAQGVLVNPMGPRTFGLELDVCRQIAATT
jgi:hypothetical protein